jgi:hypothetical protein
MGSKVFDWGSITWQGEFDATAISTARTEQMADQADFKVIRVIANLKLNKKHDLANNPQAQLQIKLIQEDIQKAGDPSKIKVAYWRGKWVVLTHLKHDASSVTVSYDKIGDPPIAVGN